MVGMKPVGHVNSQLLPKSENYTERNITLTLEIINRLKLTLLKHLIRFIFFLYLLIDLDVNLVPLPAAANHSS